MSAHPLRRGWCPTGRRPMASGDGLLVRVHPAAGRIAPATLVGLADVAQAHGNGLIDLTSRANLQLRGLREATLAPAWAALNRLGLLEAEGAPLAPGLVNPLAAPATLARAAAIEAALPALPDKFAITLDDGVGPGLGDVEADIRFEACASGFRVALAGTARDATVVGACAADAVVAVAVALARSFLAQRSGPDAPRRIRDLQAPAALAAGLPLGPAPPRSSVVQASLGARSGFAGVAAPFGRLDAATGRLLASAAEAAGVATLRLTPWRAILMPAADPARLVAVARAAGLIVDEDDPRAAVAACPGAPACPRGTTATQADALALAGLARRLARRGVGLHVSGCEKGCARAVASPVTLVGRAGAYDLVRHGRAGDPPVARGLGLAQAAAFCETMA